MHAKRASMDGFLVIQLCLLLTAQYVMAQHVYIPTPSASEQAFKFPLHSIDSRTKYGDRRYSLEGVISGSSNDLSQGILFSIRLNNDESIVVEQFRDTLYVYAVVANAPRTEKLISNLKLPYSPTTVTTTWLKIDVSADDFNRFVKLQADDQTASFRWTIPPGQQQKRFHSMIFRGYDGDPSDTLTGKGFKGCIQIDDVAGYRTSFLLQLEKELFRFCESLPSALHRNCVNARQSCQVAQPIGGVIDDSNTSPLVFSGTSRFDFQLPSYDWMPNLGLVHLDFTVDAIRRHGAKVVLFHLYDGKSFESHLKILLDGSLIVLQSDWDSDGAADYVAVSDIVARKQQYMTIVLKPFGFQVALNGRILAIDRVADAPYEITMPKISIGAAAEQKEGEVPLEGTVSAVVVETDVLALELLDMFRNYQWHWLSLRTIEYVDYVSTTSSTEEMSTSTSTSTIEQDANLDDPAATVALVIRDIEPEAAADVFKFHLAIEEALRLPPYNFPSVAILDTHVLSSEEWVMMEITFSSVQWANQLKNFLSTAKVVEVQVGDRVFHAHLLGTEDDREAAGDALSVKSETLPSEEPQRKGSSKSAMPLIVAIVCGCILLAAIAVGAAWVSTNSKRKKKENEYRFPQVGIESSIPRKSDRMYAELDTDNLPVMKEINPQPPVRSSRMFEEPATLI